MVSRRKFLENSGTFLLLYLMDPKEALGISEIKKKRIQIEELKRNLATQEHEMDVHFAAGKELEYFEKLESLVKDFRKISKDYNLVKEAILLLNNGDYSGLEDRLIKLEDYISGGYTAWLGFYPREEEYEKDIKFNVKNFKGNTSEKEFLSTVLNELKGDLGAYSAYIKYVDDAFEIAKGVAKEKDPRKRFYAAAEKALHCLSLVLNKEVVERYINLYRNAMEKSTNNLLNSPNLDEQKYFLLRKLNIHGNNFVKINDIRMALNKINFLRNYYSAQEEYEKDINRIGKDSLFFKRARNALICFMNIESIKKKIDEYLNKTNNVIGRGHWISDQRLAHYREFAKQQVGRLVPEDQVRARNYAKKYFENLEQESLKLISN